MYNLSNYKNIILDCDGVILNSNSLKTNALRKVLKNYDNKYVEKFINYHEKNGGISRYKKFDFFFKEILRIKNYEEEYLKLLNSLKKILLKDLLNSEIDKYLLKFFCKYKSKSIVVVSGGDQEELRYIFKKKKINQ